LQIDDQLNIREFSDDCRMLNNVARMTMLLAIFLASLESRIWRERENCQTILCSYRCVWLASRNSCSWENWKAFAHEFLFYFPSWILHRIFFRYLNLQVVWRATEGSTLLRRVTQNSKKGAF